MIMWFTVVHKTAINGSIGGSNVSDSDDVNDGRVANAVKTRYCTLGLVDQCQANEQCVVRRKPTVLRSRSGLCRCMPGFTRHPRTGLCINGTCVYLI